ncbi:replication initiation protein [Erwinia billingiae]|uniref:replication initiation protein n=1 Tax=Erwinia billingiae TaxID=182337 RepID=UPI0019D0DD49|nr:replication initiation protein [Erwinia billingiae]
MPESLRANFAEMKITFLVPAMGKINALTPLKVSVTGADNGKLVFSFLPRPLPMPPLNA